jgi:hypothetical protein
VRKLLLLGVAALLLACSVFATTAAAQEPGDVTIDTVTLGPGGSVIVTGTIECEAGGFYSGNVTVRQRGSGNTFNTASGFFNGQCEGTGPTTFTTEPMFADSPFHGGRATVSVFGEVCDPNFACNRDELTQEVRLSR